MTNVLLILASALSAFGLFYHAVRGGKYILKPLLAAELHHVPKHTLVFSWHWGTLTMAILTACYAAPVFRPDFMPLAMLATVYGYWLGGLSVWTMRKEKFRLEQMPQWVVFWAASFSGLLAWGVV